MKKRLKKLILSRETLRNLSSSEALAALGAATNTSCRCRLETGCECETQGCTVSCYPACYSIGC